MDFSQHLVISDSVFAQEIDGEIVLLDMNSENYFGLDEVASEIWRQLNANKSLEEVQEHLLTQYDASEARLHADIIAFVTQLLDDGLAVVAA